MVKKNESTQYVGRNLHCVVLCYNLISYNVGRKKFLYTVKHIRYIMCLQSWQLFQPCFISIPDFNKNNMRLLLSIYSEIFSNSQIIENFQYIFCH